MAFLVLRLDALLLHASMTLLRRVRQWYHSWYWWRSRCSRLGFNEFKLTWSMIFDFATSTKSGHEPSYARSSYSLCNVRVYSERVELRLVMRRVLVSPELADVGHG